MSGVTEVISLFGFHSAVDGVDWGKFALRCLSISVHFKGQSSSLVLLFCAEEMES